MDFWEDLSEFIKSEQVVPVIGPELLKVRINGKEVLLYHHIASVLAAELRVDTADLPPDYTINDVVREYLETGHVLSNTDYRRIKALLENTPMTVPEPLTKLARIKPFKLFVCTTFDALMEQALNEVRAGTTARTRIYVPNEVRDEADLPYDYNRLRDPMVFRLFGKVSSRPNYVVTEEDMLEFIHSLQSEKQRPKLLFDELKNNHLLFIGNNFSYWLARFFIRLARGSRFTPGARDNAMMQYLADEPARKDANFTFFLRSFGRDQVEIYTDTGPVGFVDKLFDSVQERFPELILPEKSEGQPAPAEDDKVIFLSYAREDSEAVCKIAATLEEAGLSVWLDRNRIRHGEAWSDKIEESIRTCSLFFPVISRNTQRRKEGVFFEEWRDAEAKARRMNPDATFIIPIPIDSTPVPARFASLHYEVFANGQLTEEFVTRVKHVLSTADQGEEVASAY